MDLALPKMLGYSVKFLLLPYFSYVYIYIFSCKVMRSEPCLLFSNVASLLGHYKRSRLMSVCMRTSCCPELIWYWKKMQKIDGRFSGTNLNTGGVFRSRIFCQVNSINSVFQCSRQVCFSPPDAFGWLFSLSLSLIFSAMFEIQNDDPHFRVSDVFTAKRPHFDLIFNRETLQSVDSVACDLF